MRVLAWLAIGILFLPVSAAEPEPEEASAEQPECTEPSATVRGTVVVTCQDGYWRPLGCVDAICNLLRP